MARTTGLARPDGAAPDAPSAVPPRLDGVPAQPRGATRPAAPGLAPDPVADRVRATLDGVFAAVAATGEETAALLTAAAAEGRRPGREDLAVLRPGLHERLGGLVSGIGFVAAPGLLADVPAWLEWWQRGPDGTVRPLLRDLDPEHSAYADYTHWDWYALPRETGRRAVAGPYVDYLCSDEYGLTLSAPVHVGGAFVGVAAADVYLRHFEAAVLPVLQALPVPARLVNARGRVAASTDPAHLAGSLTRGPDFAAVLDGPPAVHHHDGLLLTPCQGTPLVLVTPEAGALRPRPERLSR
ncbi:cache domain-containing protein [Streptomyces sp. NPDC014779]|uniref:cache domain-containing protein n=1 Tax=unclassified Streptomyces TaxID=2593676 RepID=UPI0036FB1C27